MYLLAQHVKYLIWNYREKSAALLFSYVKKATGILLYVPDHLRLHKILKPFSLLGLLAERSHYTYLYKYLSCSLTTGQRAKILANHYKFIKQNLPYHILCRLYKSGLTCWSETRNSDVFEIRLINSYPHETEGSLSLIFNINGKTIYTVSFSICQGSFFGLIDDQIMYVSRIQGAKESLDIIAKSSKLFNDNTPPSLLLSAIEGIALSMGIKTIVGISLQNQIGYAKSTGDAFQKDYDAFWKNYESVKISNGDFLISLPMRHKVLSLIKSKHRNRTINKRKVRQDVSRKVYSYFINEVLTAKKIRINAATLRVVKEIKATA